MKFIYSVLAYFALVFTAFTLFLLQIYPYLCTSKKDTYTQKLWLQLAPSQ